MWKAGARVARESFVYGLYERRLMAQIKAKKVPEHVGVILDGNRRWAKRMGFGASQGHRRGADKIEEFLGWARAAGVRIVTLWLLSTDNLSRDPAELSPLLDIIADAVDELAATRTWRLRLVGAVDLLPAPVAARLRDAVAATATGPARDDPRMQVNIAVGYGGRQEIADAVRAGLRERAAVLGGDLGLGASTRLGGARLVLDLPLAEEGPPPAPSTAPSGPSRARTPQEARP